MWLPQPRPPPQQEAATSTPPEVPPPPPDAFGLSPVAASEPYGFSPAATAAAFAQTEASWPLALAGGLAAAVVGGVVWAVVVASSNYEVGIVAWAIGALAGLAAVRVGGGRGPALQGIAVGCALLGIVLGKYGAFVHEIREAWTILLPGAPQRFGYLSGHSVSAFRSSLRDVFGGYDLLWATLAVVSAWRIPSPGRSR